MSISKILINLDRFNDYVPFASSATNFVDLFQKCTILPILNRKKDLKLNDYYNHLNNKPFLRCFIALSVPVLGNILIGIVDYALREKKPKVGGDPIPNPDVDSIPEPTVSEEITIENIKRIAIKPGPDLFELL